MRLHPLHCFSLSLLVVSSAAAADYRAETLAEPPPTGELSSEIAGQLAPQGIRVIRGSSSKYCDLWLSKEWEVRADFEPAAGVIYPFNPGQLVGVARFWRRGADCRDQRISKGLYTMRYAQQPVDGAHVGTSLTRDFLLLVRADDDTLAGATDKEQLIAQSSEAAQSSHPCLLSLQRAASGGSGPVSLAHDEQRDFWILQLRGTAKSGGTTQQLPVDLVIVGVFEE